MKYSKTYAEFRTTGNLCLEEIPHQYKWSYMKAHQQVTFQLNKTINGTAFQTNTYTTLMVYIFDTNSYQEMLKNLYYAMMFNPLLFTGYMDKEQGFVPFLYSDVVKQSNPLSNNTCPCCGGKKE